MAEEFKIGCQQPTIKSPAAEAERSTPDDVKEEKSTMLKVGKPAPEFTAPAFHKGKFANINLSDYKGKWVLLCFYPGDFTFV